MYSRAARTFLQPDKDKANPNLGPGCYTRNEDVAIPGKPNAAVGYAPFSSLSPRISYFDHIISSGPPPGSYESTLGDTMTHRTEGAAIFGRSKTRRFENNTTEAPGPDAYRIPSTIQCKNRPKMERKRLGFGLNQKPLLIEDISDDQKRVAIRTREVIDVSDSEEVDATFQAHGHNAASRPQTQFTIPKTASDKNDKHALIWRRKHIPPSIPKGKNVFGYDETNGIQI